MSDEHDPLEGLFDATPETVVAEEKPAEQVQPTAQEAPAGEAEVVAPEATPEPKMVPIEALHEARRRATEAEARLAAAPKVEEKVEALAEPDLQAIFGDRPNPKEDLEGYLAWNEGVTRFNALNTTLNFSERMARKEHGDELTDKVKDWAQKKFGEDPAFTQRVLFDPDPYEVALKEYQKLQETEQLQNLPEEVRKGLSEDELELIRQHRASNQPGGGQTAEAQPSSPPARAENGQFKPRRSPEAPSSSIANAPSSGRKSITEPAVGPGVAFDTTFRN